MSKWLTLNDEEIFQKLREGNVTVHKSEDDHLTSSEYELGLCFFKRGTGRTYAKDLDSGMVSSGGNAGEALDDLRGKMRAT